MTALELTSKMKKYIILLRGINVSGKNKIPMVELRKLLNDLEFKNIQTYIQSGNIILESRKSKSETCKIIKEAILNLFGFDIGVIARTIPELKNAVETYPFSILNPKIVAFVFLDKKSEIKDLQIPNSGEDQFKIVDDMVYIYCPSSFADTKLSNSLFERKLNVRATTRNYNTTIKLLALATN